MDAFHGYAVLVNSDAVNSFVPQGRRITDNHTRPHPVIKLLRFDKVIVNSVSSGNPTVAGLSRGETVSFAAVDLSDT